MSDIKFDTGTVVHTANAQAAFDSDTMEACLRRHECGDWGDLCEEDRPANEDGVKNGGQIMSVYKIDSKELWIITDPVDYSGGRTTTFLLPEDY
jgi:hypothetical protein